MSTATDLVVPSRFCGPPRSGNGGWTSGALVARTLGPHTSSHGPVQVTLRTPPPLETPMRVVHTGTTTTLEHGGTLVAEALEVAEEIPTTRLVDTATAEAASALHPGKDGFFFDTCFVCGDGRSPGDGLRIFPGPVPGDPDSPDGRAAAPWTPDPSTGSPDVPAGHASLPCTWAALDCVGAWSDDLMNRPMVLGRMTARVHALPVIGEPHVVVGRVLERDERRSSTASALFTASGHEVARASHVWFVVDPGTFT